MGDESNEYYLALSSFPNRRRMTTTKSTPRTVCLAAIANGNLPIPFRTRKRKQTAPMIVWEIPCESRTLPGFLHYPPVSRDIGGFSFVRFAPINRPNRLVSPRCVGTADSLISLNDLVDLCTPELMTADCIRV